jgi:MYXO-CTERM domain-containing protein
MMTKRPDRLLLPALALLCLTTGAYAGPMAITQGDVALTLWSSADGTSYTQLESATGFFGRHRCQCADTLSPELQLTTSGSANLGSSTVGVTFMLGASCLTSPSSCINVGSLSFTVSQSATSPTFSSNLVFQAAAGTTAVNCNSLPTGSTTLWAILTQDGAMLPFAPSIELPVTTATVAAPTAVTAIPANNGLLVGWTPPKDASLVTGYQVLCSPGPASPKTAAYESCGLSTGTTPISPANATQVCSDVLSASATSVLLSGLVNDTSYTVAVVAIDPSGGVSAVSPTATAIPQTTLGFWEVYKQDGGSAAACSFSTVDTRGRWGGLLLLIGALGIGVARRRRSLVAGLVATLTVTAAATACAQDGMSDPMPKETDDWARVNRSEPRLGGPPNWGFEVGVSWYRPAIDQEAPNGYHPFADVFTGARRPMWVAELDRYLGHTFGTWGVSFRAGIYRVSAQSLLSDGSGKRGGDETSLRLIPLSLSAFYRATGLPGLQHVPLVPYAKLGFDAVDWTVTSSGSSDSQSNISTGWHAAAGAMLGLAWLGVGGSGPDGIADPFALFFEWDYSKIDGLGITHSLRVGDSIWFAGVMFDL